MGVVTTQLDTPLCLPVQVTALDFDVKSSQLLQKTLPVYLAGLYEYDPQDESKDVFHEIGIHGYVSVCNHWVECM